MLNYNSLAIELSVRSNVYIPLATWEPFANTPYGRVYLHSLNDLLGMKPNEYSMLAYNIDKEWYIYSVIYP